MENKLNLRVGDVVLVKLKVAFAQDGSYPAVRGLQGGNILTIDPCDIESIISRAETDAEKIARLEAENAALRRDLQASEQEPDILINARGVCPCEPDRKVVVWLRNGEKVTQDAGCLRWRLDQKSDDVFAYMVLPS